MTNFSRFIGTIILATSTISMGFSPMAFGDRGPMTGVSGDSKFIVYYGDAYYEKDTSGVVVADANGNWTLNETTISGLSQFDVVVLQPNQPSITPEVVSELRTRGVDYILGYISIGEDFIDTAVEAPQPGDGSGPMVVNSTTLKFEATNGGLASYYVDTDTQVISYNAAGTINGVATATKGVADGVADVNPIFWGYMVNPDANWVDLIQKMRIGGSTSYPSRTNKAGLDQLSGSPLTGANLQDRTGDFGFDGFFLDTIDTAGPYDAPGWYPWTLQDMQATIKTISDTYTDKAVLANRGGFFFQAGLQSPVTSEYPAEYSIRPYINAFLFESYMYDSSATDVSTSTWDDEGANLESEFYLDNKYNQLPKIVAEAARPDGFTIFALEYLETRLSTVPTVPSLVMNEDVGTYGMSTSLASGRALDTIDFYIDSLYPLADTSAPTWGDTSYGYMASGSNSTAPTTEPQIIGIQEATMGTVAGEAIVRWGVTYDQNPVTYTIYYNTQDVISSATAVEVTDEMLEIGEDYEKNAAKPAYQATLTGIADGSYYFWVRAQDSLGNSESNDVSLNLTISASSLVQATASNLVTDGAIVVGDGSAADFATLTTYPTDPQDVPTGGTVNVDWQSVTVAHDSANFYFLYEAFGLISVNYYMQVWVDTDNNSATGYTGVSGEFPIGAEYMIEGQNLYKYNQTSGTAWDWQTGQRVGYSWFSNYGEIFIPKWWMGSPTSMRFFLKGRNDTNADGTIDDDDAVDYYPDTAISGGSFFNYTETE